MGIWFNRLWPEVLNPSLVEIEAVVEQARRDVEIAQAELIKFMQENQESQKNAMEVQQAAQAQEHKEMMAKFQAERAASEAAQAQVHKEMMAMVQAERVANEARLMAETAAHAANEEAKQRAAEAGEERKRIAAIQEHIQKDARASHEHTKKLEEAANAAKKAAVEELEKANAAREEAERKLAEGIQPVVTPTPDEVRTVKQIAQYREDLFHIAVAGAAAGGKSSLINAFRGLRNMDINIGAAATGVVETTTVMARCPDPNTEYPYVWYDVPGAGTMTTPDWQYFNDQGLYIYDCIIVLFDSRFTMTDIAILIHFRRFKIPTYIVRSKADQHIRNLMKDKGYDSDHDEDRKLHYHNARQQFIQETRQSVKDNLENANIPDARCREGKPGEEGH
ncbi:interferon-inducible GTPase-domain-containing protein [Suillus subaureus]|uniref:Interferon-inducible GTPase-domain-containing protein n=1 Tax=Suillus subaureus TaxID=48587 RepID=A0A9P7DXE8_9AGAM|nr:interferon-inducible GTPase-domain-containing protein [Suillus subaureus]KAG1805675.1 interferon-inducible GTPase-domain-containing protein [Suillus subaureus]